MLKTILFGVLLSLVLWAVTFNYLFDHNMAALTIVIAAAVAVLVALLLRALTKPGASPFSIGIQLIVIALGTLIALFAVSKLVPLRSCPAPGPITISCNPPAATPPDLCADKGTEVEWITAGVEDGITIRVHDFKKKRFPLPPRKESPFLSDPPPGNNTAPMKGKVARSGEFKYSLTCEPAGGPPETEDPIIDVPKGGGKY